MCRALLCSILRAGDSNSTQPKTIPAAAAVAPTAAVPAVAAAVPDAVQQQRCSKQSRGQPVQQAEIPAGDAALGNTEVGPQAKRKRSAADSSVQQAEPKRAKAGCKVSHRHKVKLHADEAGSVGQGTMHVAPVPHQQQPVRVRKTTARSALAL